MSNRKTLSPLKRCKYRLTYPMHGNKIYESKSFDKAIRKCYHEFKQLTDIHEGMFVVTDIDNKIDYTFEVNTKKLRRLVKKNNNKSKDLLSGGNKISTTETVNNNFDDKNQISVQKDNTIDKELINKMNILNKRIESLESKLNNKSSNISSNINAAAKVNIKNKNKLTIPSNSEDELYEKYDYNNLNNNSDNMNKSDITSIKTEHDEGSYCIIM